MNNFQPSIDFCKKKSLVKLREKTSENAGYLINHGSSQHEDGDVGRESGEGDAGAGDEAAGDADRPAAELVDQPADDGAGHEVHAA